MHSIILQYPRHCSRKLKQIEIASVTLELELKVNYIGLICCKQICSFWFNYQPKHLVAGASLQTPLDELTALPQTS